MSAVSRLPWGPARPRVRPLMVCRSIYLRTPLRRPQRVLSGHQDPQQSVEYSCTSGPAEGWRSQNFPEGPAVMLPNTPHSRLAGRERFPATGWGGLHAGTAGSPARQAQEETRVWQETKGCPWSHLPSPALSCPMACCGLFPTSRTLIEAQLTG